MSDLSYRYPVEEEPEDRFDLPYTDLLEPDFGVGSLTLKEELALVDEERPLLP